jgi:hypothetical protein
MVQGRDGDETEHHLLGRRAVPPVDVHLTHYEAI